MDDKKHNIVDIDMSWDISLNADKVIYSKGAHVANAKKQCIIRGPFWSSGRHLINIKVLRVRDIGIGVIDKGFTVDGSKYMCQDCHSFSASLWKSGSVYNQNELVDVDKKIPFYNKPGTIVTVDVDLDKRVLNWAVNGQYLTKQNAITGIPEQVALAVSLCKENDSVEIIQYKRL